jgi:type IV secretory pathway VirB4 component
MSEKKYVVKDLAVRLIKPEVSDDMKIPIIEPKEFIPQHSFRMYMCGGSGSGKTNFLLNLLTIVYNKYFHKVYLISANYYNDLIYRALDGKIPEDQIITDPDEIDPVLQDIFEQQEEEKNKTRRVLIVIDDFMNEVANSKAMQAIFTKGRARNISVILINQSYKTVHPKIRSNCTHMIFFGTNEAEIKKIWEEHGQVMPLPKFQEVFQVATEPKANDPKPFLLIDYRNTPDLKYRRNLDSKIEY